MNQFNGVVADSTNEGNEAVKRYEGLFILNTAGKEEGIKETIDKISAEITAAGGKVETVQKMDEEVLRPGGRQEAHRRLLRERHFCQSRRRRLRPVEAPSFALNEEVFRVVFTNSPEPKAAK